MQTVLPGDVSHDTIKTHSTQRATIVAAAAPSTPKPGTIPIPKNQYISSTVFVATATIPARIGATVSPVSRNVLA